MPRDVHTGDLFAQDDTVDPPGERIGLPCDTSLIILQSALDRPCGTLLPFRPHNTDRTASCVRKLIRRGWVRLMPVVHMTDPFWSSPRGKPNQTIVITEAGLDALNLEQWQWPEELRRR